MNTKAFTLIELLIVIAIISILALIAVPNFLEAQTRAKVARTMADLKAQSTALESYYIDFGQYTRDSDSSLDLKGSNGMSMNISNPMWGQYANGFQQLTTPIAYLSSFLSDPFSKEVTIEGMGGIGYRIGSGTWSYSNPSVNPQDNQGSSEVFRNLGPRHAYVLIGVGPDGARARTGYKCFPYHPVNDASNGPPSTSLFVNGQPFCYTDYDPSNGTSSVGDIYVFGGAIQTGRFMRNGRVVGSQFSTGGGAW